MMSQEGGRSPWADALRVAAVAAVFVVLALVVTRPEVRDYILNVHRMRRALQGHDLGWQGRALSALVFVVLWGVLVAAGVPRLWASAAGGVVYGAVLGTALSLVASAMGASILFFAGSTFLAGVAERRLGERLMQWRDRFKENAFWWVLYVRLFPFANSTVVSLACGGARIPFREYIVASVLGFVPLAVVFATFGSGGVKGNIWQVGLACALLLLTFFLRRLIGRWKPGETGAGEAAGGNLADGKPDGRETET
ncbi:MAG TPA: VTT domain-containing protein [Deltaproteobacteria bacterium]|nr:VTT domain-containing protein [Deltaproteobacteria bacterium]